MEGLKTKNSKNISANIKNMSRIALFHKVLSDLIKDIKKTGIKISEELESDF